ncbi:DUF5133 domain-containing protein [Streptomyces sp. NPDC048389]|uniref:DUF5133 domain-containing protein n=1 Tax=Streptomyces sp. NPDC048389 TaxID=3154622 RepID=UPI003456B7DB
MAHPVILRNAVDEYQELVARYERERSGLIHARLQDAACALCAATGARTADGALAAARQELEAGEIAVPGARPAGPGRRAPIRRSA